jgi:hypothetical protein
MCDKCDELDRKIEHYKSLAGRILDQLTLDRLAEMIAQALAEKVSLHPDKESSP